jgi:hypothetical protein
MLSAHAEALQIGEMPIDEEIGIVTTCKSTCLGEQFIAKWQRANLSERSTA